MNKCAALLLPLALLLAACAPAVANPPPSPVATRIVAPTQVAPTRSATPAPPTHTPTATPSVTSALGDADLAVIESSPRLMRDQVALARELGTCRSDPGACPSVARTTPLDAQVGDVRSFSVVDFDTDRQYNVNAVLRYIGPVVLMYVEQDLVYRQADLERAATIFEQEIYPRTRAIFGAEVQPGVDGDNRLSILNAHDPNGNLLGYYSSQDSLPTKVNRFSNERDMFFMNADRLVFGDNRYLQVLSHEFQHMIHENQQSGSALWFNEGCSQLSEDLNGYVDDGFITGYLYTLDTQLNSWGGAPGEMAKHYGAAHLFLRYLYAQYAGDAQLRTLIRASAGDNVAAFVALASQSRPDSASFGQLVADWSVANLVDDPAVGDGRYTYNTGTKLPSLLPMKVVPKAITPNVHARGAQHPMNIAADAQLSAIGYRLSAIFPSGQINGTAVPFSPDYLALPEGTTSLEFRGDTHVRLAAELPRGRYAWWSGRSDNSLATLTRAVDLRGLKAASLSFDTWYEMERVYDYAFVTVSTDGGKTWVSFPGSLTTTDDPQGVNYGNGITGVSGVPDSNQDSGQRGRWVSERMDLSDYAGSQVLLRFWQINDQGLSDPGMLIDNIAIPERGFRDDVESGTGDWQAAGFVRVDGDLSQRWDLRLVITATNGKVRVEPLTVGDDGRATAHLAAGERGVLMVLATTLHTSETAGYSVETR